MRYYLIGKTTTTGRSNMLECGSEEKKIYNQCVINCSVYETPFETLDN